MGENPAPRGYINTLSLLATFLVLYTAVTLADTEGSFVRNTNNIVAILDNVLKNIRDGEKIDYTDINDGVEFKNFSHQISFKPVGMAGLYNLTGMFMKLAINEFDPDLLFEFNSKTGDIKIKPENWQEILKENAGILTLVIVLLLFIVFLPFCGLCFCCCRCCGNCGARTKPCDKKQDLCRKVCQASLLIIFGTALLFCVVCAFGSNEQLQNGLQELPSNLNNSVKDTNKFFDLTDRQMSNLLVTNYEQFEKKMNDTMDNGTSAVMDALLNMTKAISMTTMAQFVENLDHISENLSTVKVYTNDLRVRASQLNDAMRKLKNDLLQTLNQCSSIECEQLKQKINELQTNIDFDKLPDISQNSEIIQELDPEKLKIATKNGVEALNRIKTDIGNSMDKNIEDAKKELLKAGRTVKDNHKQVRDTIENLKKRLTDSATPALDSADNYIKEHGRYVYYGGLAISCVLLLIAVFIVLGLICGICGKRPDGYGDNCCNKGAGGQFLLCGVMIMFFFGFLIAVVTLVAFVSGVFPQRAVCDSLQNPGKSKIIDMVDKSVDFDDLGFKDLSLKKVFSNCKGGKSAYEVFNLKSMFNLDNIKKQFDINETLDGITPNIPNLQDFTILNDNDRAELEKLKNKDIDVKFSTFQDELEGKNFTSVSLDELKNKLDDLINKRSTPSIFIPELTKSKLNLEMYDEKILVPMKTTVSDLLNLVKQMNTDICMNKGSFHEAISDLIQEIDDSQNQIRNLGQNNLTALARGFAESVENIVYGYLNRVVDNIEKNVGKCDHLYHVFNATLISTCDKILTPLNGFWFSLYCSLILFIPLIIISVKLASLYQKYRSYGQYVETDYLYDAYSDRDNIPLNSRRNKKKTKKSKRYEDRPVGTGGEVLSREHASGSNHHQDTRYADMAPKHWEDFPAGGPPQYHRAPTEYERPPPYYYPATGESN